MTECKHYAVLEARDYEYEVLSDGDFEVLEVENEEIFKG